MDLTDEILIPAPRDRVYAALNDTDILREAIPGCEELTRLSENELEARVVLRIGPVKARFGGHVTLSTAGAPETFSLTGEGNGGVAGFAKGGADVELLEQEDGTLLRYTARVDIGGKIAQLGSRLIVGTARKLSRSFFEAFAEAVTSEGPVSAA